MLSVEEMFTIMGLQDALALDAKWSPQARVHA